MTALFVAAVLPAVAHDFWMEPSRFRIPSGEILAIRLRVGQQFTGDPVPRSDQSIARFELVGGNAAVPLIGHDGADPAGLARLEGGGTRVAVYESRGKNIDIDAATFERYLGEEGLDAARAARAAHGEQAAATSERFHRCAKALIEVDPAAGDASIGSGVVTVPVGLTLELVPLADPRGVAPGTPIPFRLLFRGRPLPGALVVALERGHAERRVEARTSADGLAQLALPEAGRWLVKAVQIERAPPGTETTWQSWWASLTFESEP